MRVTLFVRGQFDVQASETRCSWEIVGSEPPDLIFTIETDRGGFPPPAPNPATRAELTAWIERLRARGFRVVVHVPLEGPQLPPH